MRQVVVQQVVIYEVAPMEIEQQLPDGAWRPVPSRGAGQFVLLPDRTAGSASV